MTRFIKSATKKSLLALVKKGTLDARGWARFLEALVTKDELDSYIVDASEEILSSTNKDLGDYVRRDGTKALTDDWDAGSHEIKAETLESDVTTGTAPLTVASTTKVTNLNADLVDGQTGTYYLDSDNFTGTEWTDLTDNGATTIHKHDHGNLDGRSDDDHSSYLLASDATDRATFATNWEDLTDSGPTTLHAHGYEDSTVGQKQLFRSYIDVKARNGVYSLHGALDSLDTGSALDTVPTDITVTPGTGKLLIVINAGGDVDGEITVTGTTVDRDTGAETGADTDTITVDALTTDNSSSDASGNTVHEFVGAYITSKWFKGSTVLSTVDLTLSDVDTYQVSFDQMDDTPGITLKTFDITAYATNASAWLYAYLYTLHVTGDKCNIDTESTIDLPAAEVSANRTYRLRRGEIDEEFSGVTDGFWVEMYPGPLASTYWENINVQVWADITRTVTDGVPLPEDPENPLYGETPRYHHWNDETVDALPSSVSGTLINGHDPPVIIGNNPGAPYGYNRSMNLNSSNYTDAVIDLGHYVGFGASGIRVALLLETYDTVEALVIASVSDQSQQVAWDGYNSIFFQLQESTNPDTYRHRRYINDVEDFDEDYQPGTNDTSGTSWRWWFFEQLEDGNTKWEVYDLDGTLDRSVTRAYQGSAGIIPTDLRYLCVVGHSAAPSYCAQIWVGTSDDDWPSLPMSPMTNL